MRPPTRSHRPLRSLFIPGRNHLLLLLLAVVGASLLALTNIPRALACPVCVAPDKMTLTGSGINGTASVTDPSVLAWFSTALFMGFEQRTPVAVPLHTGVGVEMTRYYTNTGTPPSFGTQGFDHMRYFPGAHGQPGYILYEGPVSAEARDYAHFLDMWQRTGKWFALTSDENANIQQLLTAAHAVHTDSLGSSGPSSVGTTDTPPPAILRALMQVPPPVVILLGCALLLCLGVGYRLWYHHRRPPFAPVEDAID